MSLDVFTQVLSTIIAPLNLIILGVGVIMGIIFGACPGISTSMGIAIMLPFTYAMPITSSMSMLIGGGVSGGLITAILINIPGTPGSICTTFDGYPMAERGEAGKALGVGMLYSFCGGVISLIILMICAPLLAKFALKFTAVEYFAITLFSFLLIAGLAGKSLIKGAISAILGVMLTTVGISPLQGSYRYTFGIHSLDGGFQLVTAVIGLYAVAAILKVAEFDKPKIKIATYKLKGFGVDLQTFKDHLGNMFRSSGIGTFIGILPGIGQNIANVLSYTVAKNSSKHPEKFGTGCIDGLIASETSNNAVTGGAMVPLLTLGIPGDAGTAMMLAALTIHGLQAGPLLFSQQPVLVYSIFGFMLFANIIMLLVEYFGIKSILKLLKVPDYILFPIIIVICCSGAFSINNRIFDVWAVLFFAVIAYGLRKFKFPMPPFILGFVLGNLFETNMLRAYMYTGGTWSDLMNYPIAVTFLALFAVALVYLSGKSVFKKKAI